MARKPLTAEQKLKLQDFKAQYNSIVGNIATANKELELVLEKKKLAEKELNDSILDLSHKKLVLSRDVNELEETKIDLSRKENELIKREEIILQKERELDIRKEVADKEFFAEKQKKEAELTKLKVDIILLGEKYTQLLKEISYGEDKLLQFASQINAKEIEFRSLEEKITAYANEFEERKVKCEKQIKVSEKKLADVLNKIEENKKKIDSPLLSLKQKEDAFARKEKNFQIIFFRFKKQFEKLNPGVDLMKLI